MSFALLAALAAPQDLVLKNATVWTGTDAAWSGDLVVRDGRIQPAGSAAPDGAPVRDLGGAFVMPGLQDAHGHLLGLGAALEEVDLVGTASFDEVIARVVAAAKTTPKGEWVIGRGWDQNDWPDQAMPHHAALSSAVPDHPVWLVRVDGHAALANARALERGGVDADSATPSGGEILRDGAGAPSGVLVDRAMALVSLPDPEPEAIRRRLLRAQQECLRHGLTCVHDAGVADALAREVAARHAAGQWRLRSYLMLAASETAAILRGPWGTEDDLVQVRAVKGYADGALGSRGALLLAPYSDRPNTKGLPMTAGLERLAQRCADAGMQLCVHAIGDAANRKVLDAYAATRFADGDAGRAAARFRIEHCQVIAPEDFVRFRDLHVVPSMQPTHLTSDMPWAEQRLGADRTKGAYAWRAFHALGLPVAFGSDFPVEGVDPRLGIFAAVTTRAPGGDEAMRPDQRLPVERALRGFTLDAAYAMFAEDQLGTIEPGKRADLTVFDRDLRSCPEDELLQARVLLTIVDGKVAFAADD
ncbi:MAG: amidohydrolase [Planctomycetota bacterium]